MRLRAHAVGCEANGHKIWIIDGWNPDSTPITIAGILKDTSTFETGLDGWTSLGLAFARDNAGTPSFATGPSSGAGGSTWYMYAETSAPNFNAVFDMQKTYPVSEEIYGVTFQYHKYGADIGSAVLESSHDGTTWKSLWTQSGNKGDQWNHATVYTGTGQTILRFTCVPCAQLKLPGARYYMIVTANVPLPYPSPGTRPDQATRATSRSTTSWLGTV